MSKKLLHNVLIINNLKKSCSILKKSCSIIWQSANLFVYLFCWVEGVSGSIPTNIKIKLKPYGVQATN